MQLLFLRKTTTSASVFATLDSRKLRSHYTMSTAACRTSLVFKRPERVVMSENLIRTLLSSWPDNLKCRW